MNSNTAITTLLRQLWWHVSSRRRRQFMLLFLLTLIASFAEIFSIGAVLPFLGVLTDPARIYEMPNAEPLIRALKLTAPKQLLLPLTIIFGIATLFAAIMRLLLLWVNTRLSFATGADLSISIYRRTLYQPYSVHCSRNSSEVIDGISSKANGVIYNIIAPVLMLISSSVILIAILFALLYIQPVIALASFGCFALIYAGIILVTRKQLMFNSKCVAKESTQVIKSLQEGLGGIRDVLIDGSQETYCQIYQNSDSLLRRAQGNSLFIGISPRYTMEALGMLLIASLAYALAREEDGIAKAIPILGVLALAAQRLLPVLQQAYGAWTQINGGRASLMDVLRLLNQPLPEYAKQPFTKLPFKQNIALKSVGFRYGQQTPYVIQELSLTINKGSRIGFIGTTGSGKSTLLDIVMGLLQPTDGVLEVDGQAITLSNNQAWQARIAHVPQAIFLADTTVAENIAFGVPQDQIDYSRVKWAAKQAQISDSIEGWSKQYQTVVGEGGIRISGGQKQRIGIARALYKQADVIIFDEATSALDAETEKSVMQAIESLSQDLTLLIIAHRITTLKNCTQIVKLEEGSIKSIGCYHTIFNEANIT